MDLWPPSSEPIAQGLPTSSGLGLFRIVLAFAKSMPDGMDGWQIENVEVHRCDVGEPGFAIFEGAVLARGGRAGAGKDFIPGGEARAFTADADAEFFRITGAVGVVGISAHQGFERWIERRGGSSLLVWVVQFY